MNYNIHGCANGHTGINHLNQNTMKIKKQVTQTVETEISLPAILKRSVTANTYDIIHAYEAEGAERVNVISFSGGVPYSVVFGQKAEDWGHLFDGNITECSAADVITATRDVESFLQSVACNAELIENSNIIKAAMHIQTKYGPMKPKVTVRNSCAGCKYDELTRDEYPCVSCSHFDLYQEEPTDE